MYKSFFLFCVLIFAAGCSTLPEETQQHRSYDLFLLIGQSNMAGRGKIERADHQTHPQVWSLDKHNNWILAKDPIHFDKPKIAGVGPGVTFGQKVATMQPSVTVGLIPAAVGGSAIASWVPGGFHATTKTFPYDDALARAKIAMQNGRLRAILWHQGESDSFQSKIVNYKPALIKLAQRLRGDLNAEDVPFIIGTVGDFVASRRPYSIQINQILIDAPNFIPNSYLVSSDGLVDKGDSLHFDSGSAKTLGLRYAKAYFEAIGFAQEK